MSRGARNQPKIDYHDVQAAWFNYEGQPYPVATAPVKVFRAAVLEKVPAWRFHASYGPLLRLKELDLLDRWYLLCGLADVRKGLVLYARESAGQVQSKVG